MYIFNRSTTLNRHRLVEATGAAVEVAGMVTEITGMAVSVFASRYGQPLNTIGWSARLESQAELQAVTDKLIANEDYLGWVSSHTELFEGRTERPALDRRVVDVGGRAEALLHVAHRGGSQRPVG